MRPIPTLALLILLTAGNAAASGWMDRLRGSEATDPVILISIDSFHPDYLDRGLTPTLQALADEGVRARWMTPSFPSKTFPNHYSIVTGLVPDHHGIVDNNMIDAELGRFTLQNRDAVGDGRWWQGEPIWVTAQRQNLRTATLFWPGSEAAIGGVRPDDWSAFDAALGLDARIDRVLGWLDRSPRRRPHFITLYFEQVDASGHLHGPDSPQIEAAMVAVDNALKRLVDGLDARGLRDKVNLVIVSDHGMAELDEDKVIVIEDVVDSSWVEIVSLSEIPSFNPKPGHDADAAAALLAPLDGMTCHRKADLPPDWNYGSHARVPAYVCLLEEGWRIRRRESFNPWQAVNVNKGAHGYDPQSPSMRALFVANGPAFKTGLLVEPLQNIHVYPLLAHLLGITAAPNDGDTEVTAPMLAPAPSGLSDQKSVQP
jgi:predicted AlkP superfamily pyrophosphatase or phosphodiesterase